MRQKRAKAYRKLMALYSMSFGFRQPYQVLVDSLMCKEAVSAKIELARRLEDVLQGAVKPMITQCCIHELYLQGKEVQLAVDLAKTFERRKCNHREAIPGDECLLGVIGDANKHRYAVATQSQPLRQQLRRVPAVPLVHVNRSVMVLEPPSDATLAKKAEAEENRLRPRAEETAKLAETSAGAGPSTSASSGVGVAGTAGEAGKKRKGPKGPNPLSVKKKKKAKLDEGKRRATEREREKGESEAKGRIKGKEKDKATPAAAPTLTLGTEAAPASHEGGAVGKKRKRPSDADAADDADTTGSLGTRADGGSGSAAGVLAAARGHKRRRRRKHPGDSGEGGACTTAGGGAASDGAASAASDSD